MHNIRFVGMLIVVIGCSEATLKTFNDAPTAQIHSHADEDELVEEAASDLFGTVSDSNHAAEDLLVNWYVNGDVVCADQTPEPDGYTLCNTSLSTGSTRILLAVTDPGTASGNDSVTIEIAPSAPPVATLTDPFDGGHYSADEPIEFAGRVLDDEDNFEQLTASIDSDVDGAIDVDTALDADGHFSSFGALSAGTHVVTLTAIDTSGKSGTDSQLVVVAPANEAPSIETVDITPDPASATDALSCSYTGFADPNDDDDESRYAWAINGTDAGDSNTLDSGYVGGDSVSCTVTPNDGTVDGEPLSDTIIISNTAPTVDSVEIAPDEGVTTSTTLTCTATTSDVDGEDLTVQYEWSNSGTALGSGASLTLSPDAVAPGDTVTCEATVTDATGTSDVGSDAVTVDNTGPTIAEVQITPDTGVRWNTALTCSAEATDPDGGEVTITYAWNLDGTAIGTGTNLDLATIATTTGATVLCAATATDAHGSSVSDTDTVVIENGIPEVLSVTLTPTEPTTNDTVAAVVTTADADGDSVTVSYAWTVNGIAVAETGATLDGTLFFDKHDAVAVTATPTDGIDAGSSTSAGPVTVLNTPPTAPTVSIDDTDGLICVIDIDATDADEDAVSYTVYWDVDGVSYSGTETTTELGDTVPDAALEVEQTWACTVVPNDGEEDGDSGSASILIEGCRDVLYFDGVDDQVEIPAVSGMETEMTIEAWVRLYESPTDGVLLASTLCGAVYIESDEIWLEHYPDCDGTNRRYTNSSDWVGASGPGPDSGFDWTAWDGAWHHIAVTTNAAHSASLYVDGTHIQTSTLTYDTGVSGSPYAGAIGHRQWGWLNGYIAGVRFSASERYTGDFTPAYPLRTDADTVIVYEVDGDGGSATLTDGSGSDLHGTIVDATWNEGGPDCDEPSGDFDGDGTPDEEDCMPSMGDVPRLPLWSSIATHAMDESPPVSGASWCNGSWGSQGVRDVYGRTAWRQESDWNSLWMPDPIDDDEPVYAVDVDMYLPSGDRSGEFGIDRTMAGACNMSSGGIVFNYSDERCGDDPSPCHQVESTERHFIGSRDDLFDRWVNFRFEVFQDDGLVQFWIDDEIETCFFADADRLAGPQVKFNANTSCCSHGPDLAISNLNFDIGSF
jgi:hypothetical protein